MEKYLVEFLKDALEILTEKGEAFEVFQKTKEITEMVSELDFNERDHATLICMLIDDFAEKHEMKISDYAKKIFENIIREERLFNE